MDKGRIRRLLENVRGGQVDVDQAMESLRSLPYEDVGFAKIDSHRQIRTGFPEVVFCQGKTTRQIVEILKRLCEHNECVLATRAASDVFEAVCKEIPQSSYNEAARVIVAGKPRRSPEELAAQKNYIMVVCGGTADIPVAEEAALTAETLGSRV